MAVLEVQQFENFPLDPNGREASLEGILEHPGDLGYGVEPVLGAFMQRAYHKFAGKATKAGPGLPRAGSDLMRPHRRGCQGHLFSVSFPSRALHPVEIQ
jgi:hypothetical protein